jgi:outer membrane protein
MAVVVTAFATLTVVASAFGGEEQGVAPASPPLTPVTPDNIDVSLGGGVVFAPRPYVGAHAAVIPIPVVNLRYRRLFAEGIRGGVQFVREGQLTGNAYLQANFEGLDAGDSPYLQGMASRSMSADAGAEVVYRARPVGFRVNVLSDVLGRNNGQEVSVQAVTGAPLGSRGFLLASIGPRWISANRVNYNYGVRDSEATPDRPAYVGTASWNWDLTLGANLRFAGKWSLFVLFSREAFGSSIEKSPIVAGPAAYSLISALTCALR